MSEQGAFTRKPVETNAEALKVITWAAASCRCRSLHGVASELDLVETYLSALQPTDTVLAEPQDHGEGGGVPPSGSGYSAEPEPSCTVSAVPVSIPNAALVPPIITCTKCGAKAAAFICSRKGCPVNGGAAYD